MSKTAKTDDRGRIVIPREIRETHGDRYRIVELRDRVELIPISDDPIEGLRDAVGNAFDETTIDEIKRDARRAAETHTVDEITK